MDDTQVNTNWSAKDISSSSIGFFGYRQSSDHIYSITSLPYESPDTRVVIYNVDSQGRIAAQVFGKDYFIKPGQSWAESTNTQLNLPEGCYYTYTSRVSNHGLLTQDQIEDYFKR